MNPPSQALLATVIVIGTPDRLSPAADALESLGDTVGLRAILISEGEHTAFPKRTAENTIVVTGLAPRFVNNAVASLRLSSLPAAVWWRGGSTEALEDLAALADRLVLDTDDPTGVWTRAGTLFERSAVTDLRWAKLTRWRALLAHLFDVPQVRAAAGRVTRLAIEAPDLHAGRLFAGWLASCLGWGPSVAITVSRAAASGPAALNSALLEGPDVRLAMTVKPNGTCLEAAMEGAADLSRAVPIGDGALATLIGEELGVRTRDFAFERALFRAQEIRA